MSDVQYGLGEKTKKEYFMSQDTCNIEQYIQTGFKNMHPPQSRNLEVRTDILASRPFPVNVTHWTEGEFVDFLNTHNYPACTFKDRLRTRNMSIINALVMGQYVPMEVMSEPESASRIEDALMYVQAAAASEKRLEREKERIAVFERIIGYERSYDDYYRNLANILEAAIRNHDLSILKANFPTDGQTQIVLTLRHASHPKFGSYGLLQSGKPKRLVIHESHSELAVLHVIEWKVVDAVLQRLFDASRLDVRMIVNRFGNQFIDWIPESMKRLQLSET